MGQGLQGAGREREGTGSDDRQSQQSKTEVDVHYQYKLDEKLIDLKGSIASDVIKVTSFQDRITFEVKKGSPFAERAYRLQSNEEDMTAGTPVRAFTLDTNTGKYREFTANEYAQAFAPLPDGELRTHRPGDFAVGREDEFTALRGAFHIGQDEVKGDLRSATHICFETEFFSLWVRKTEELVSKLPSSLNETLESLGGLPPVPD
jgi:hypothetical protein